MSSMHTNYSETHCFGNQFSKILITVWRVNTVSVNATFNCQVVQSIVGQLKKMKFFIFINLVLVRSTLTDKYESPGLNENCNESDDKCVGQNLSCHGGKVWFYCQVEQIYVFVFSVCVTRVSNQVQMAKFVSNHL